MQNQSDTPKSVAAGSSRVLLDNSTYFSFRRLTTDGMLDADSLYNAATFLECLVTAETVITAPTLAWSPDADDTLFTPAGPCRQLSADDMTVTHLGRVLQSAVDAALKDTTPGRQPVVGGQEDAVVQQASELMRSWRRAINEDPTRFLQVYSGAVFITDPSSESVVEGFETVVRRDADVSRHVAQFLLRTNVALQLSGAGTGTIMPYHPHSFRAGYVAQKVSQITRRSLSLGTALLRHLESEQREVAQQLRERSWLSVWGAFATLGDDAPLVLAVALSGASSPDDLLSHALALRDSREARRYRRWVSALLGAVSSGDFCRVREAEDELRVARNVLSGELKKLYGVRSGGVVRAVARVAGGIDLEDLAEGSARKLGLGLAKDFIEGGPRLAELFRQLQVRRKVALLVHLLRARKPEDELGSLVERVFGARLTEVDHQRFEELRNEQRSAMKAILDLRKQVAS